MATLYPGIAAVLAKIIPITAGECVGNDIVDSLLDRIQSSIVVECDRVEASEAAYERVYQDTLIHALAEYANHLPDYPKIVTMSFILNKVIKLLGRHDCRLEPFEPSF